MLVSLLVLVCGEKVNKSVGLMIQQLADWLTYDLLGLDATSHPPWHRHCLHDGHRGVVATRSHTTQEGYDMAPHWCVFGTITLSIILLGYLFNFVL